MRCRSPFQRERVCVCLCGGACEGEAQITAAPEWHLVYRKSSPLRHRIVLADLLQNRRWWFPVLLSSSKTVKMNGFACKANFSASDFSFAGLAIPQPTNNTLGSIVTFAHVLQIPGLNTLGVSMARLDFAPGGLNQPHTHPRASEMLFVLYGELEAGFITTANVLVSKTIKQGEIFTFPRGLVHFQINNGKGPAAAIAGFNSQYPGREDIATSLFAATPPVPDSVLSKAFQILYQEVNAIKSKLA